MLHDVKRIKWFIIYTSGYASRINDKCYSKLSKSELNYVGKLLQELENWSCLLRLLLYKNRRASSLRGKTIWTNIIIKLLVKYKMLVSKRALVDNKKIYYVFLNFREKKTIKQPMHYLLRRRKSRRFFLKERP